MPDVIQSSMWLLGLKKIDEMHKETGDSKVKLESSQPLLRTLLSLVDTAHSPSFPWNGVLK